MAFRAGMGCSSTFPLMGDCHQCIFAMTDFEEDGMVLPSWLQQKEER
jgi:hypothetical protein